jgi:hypothetical protein
MTAPVKIPLGGKEQDYDSKKSRERLINMVADVNRDGSYSAVKRLEGLTDYSVLGTRVPRSNLLVNNGYCYVVAGNNLYRVHTSAVSSDLGFVGGGGRAQILANSVPGDNQILVLNGTGLGFIFTNAGGLVKITDPDFFATVSGTILDERFWFARQGTNEIFGSEISDGFSYNPLTFASAEEKPDNAVAVIALKSALWIIGETDAEYWQTRVDTTLPIRRTNGASKQRGIRAVASLAQIGNSFAWLADDGTVRMMTDNTMSTISDLELELRIRGNGENFTAFSHTEDAIGFFVDGPVHKIYYLIFPNDGYVWGYDIKTKSAHSRESEGFDTWRVNSSVLFDQKIIVGDSVESKLSILDPTNRSEDGNVMKATLRSPTLIFDTDVSIPLISLTMETGTTTDPTANPTMIVNYTKDGETYVSHSQVSLGKMSKRKTKVRLRMFGRLVANDAFGLELIFTDAEELKIYGAAAIIEGGF